MHLKYIRPLLPVLILALSGCATMNPDNGWPQERPLGEELPTYRPPVEPVVPGDADLSEALAGDSLTIAKTLAIALNSHPKLQASAYDVRVREAERVQASKWPNPSLGAEVEEVSSSAPLSNFTGGEQVARLSQHFALGGDIDYREDVASAMRNLAGWDFETTRLDVITEARQSFVGALAAQRQLALTRNLFDVATDLLQTIAAQIEAGEISPIELERVRVERAQARIEMQRAEAQLQTARSRLAASMGAAEIAFEGLRGELHVVEPPPSLTALLPLLPRNPAIARFADVRRRRKAQLDLQQAELIPDPTVTGGIQRFGATETQAFALGLSIPIPLLDRNQGAIAAAKFNLMQTIPERQGTLVSLQSALETSYRRLTAAHAEVKVLREDVLPSAETAYEAMREGYRLGKFDLISVLDAQRTFFNARLQYIEALEDYRSAVAEVERLVATSFTALRTERNDN